MRADPILISVSFLYFDSCSSVPLSYCLICGLTFTWYPIEQAATDLGTSACMRHQEFWIGKNGSLIGGIYDTVEFKACIRVYNLQ